MLPAVNDDVLLNELKVVAEAGWELPSRDQRAPDVRHLLLLVPSDEASAYSQAAHRLVRMIDDAIATADYELLDDDSRRGLRILLGLEPGYRTGVSSPDRRKVAAPLLVRRWQDKPPDDVPAAFLRRHQTNALRQALACLRERYGQDNLGRDRDYDVLQVRRWCQIAANRQGVRIGDRTEYRVRRDGFNVLHTTESALPESVEQSQLYVLTNDGATPAQVDSIEPVTTTVEPRREIRFRLPQTYEAGEHLVLAWEERTVFSDDASIWRRDWWTAAAETNDNFEVEVSVTFDDDVQLPDVCWWFSTSPTTDLAEIGPDSLANLFDLTASRTASHTWTSAETERWIEYGVLWVWLDDVESQQRWEVRRQELTAQFNQ